ncbi:MAG: hypothetical protein KDA68_04240 [Planctomycetaceae bacterium]|nr:hypothetical protein [Planctomycetaceae bacterium]
MQTDSLLLVYGCEVFNCIETLTTEEGESLYNALKEYLEDGIPGNLSLGFRSCLEDDARSTFLQWMREWNEWRETLRRNRNRNWTDEFDKTNWPTNYAGKPLGLSQMRLHLFNVSEDFATELLKLRKINDENSENETVGSVNVVIKESPKWDKERSELSYNGRVVRSVARRAKNIRCILDAFEESAWPCRIDDPLTNGPNDQRLRETIASLNERLDELRFRADGSGEGIIWETLGVNIESSFINMSVSPSQKKPDSGDELQEMVREIRERLEESDVKAVPLYKNPIPTGSLTELMKCRLTSRRKLLDIQLELDSPLLTGIKRIEAEELQVFYEDELRRVNKAIEAIGNQRSEAESRNIDRLF